MLYYVEDCKSLIWVLLYLDILSFLWDRDIKLTWYLWGFMVFLLYYFSFSIATIIHNSMHVKTFKNNFFEYIWHFILCFALGHPVCTYESGHNRSHHRYTQTIYDVMRTSKMRYKWNFLNLLLFQPTVAFSVFKMDVKFMISQRYSKNGYFEKCILQWIFVIFSQLFLFQLNWRKFLLFVYFPHLFGQWAIVTMNILQHDGCEIDGKKLNRENDYGNDDQSKEYNLARNFTGPVINFLFFNNGYHTIHHFQPKLHWSKIPRKHAEIEHLIHPNLNEKCMFRYVWKAFIHPGKRVDYTGNEVQFKNKEPCDSNWISEYSNVPG